MNMLEFIGQYYKISPNTMEKMTRGKTSKVFKVHTNEIDYILKSHSSVKSAEMEFSCLDALSESLLSPCPYRTNDDSQYIVIEGRPYILMEFLPSQDFDRNKIDYFDLGHRINTMHKVINSSDLEVLADRFDERNMLKGIDNQTIKLLLSNALSEADYLEEYNTTIIHGDLGAWNFIYDGMNISFIDFGEMRLGSPWFDIAAVVESLKLNDQQIKSLVKGYTGRDNENNNTLNKMRKKWKLRGILALAAKDLVDETSVKKMLIDL